MMALQISDDGLFNFTMILLLALTVIVAVQVIRSKRGIGAVRRCQQQDQTISMERFHQIMGRIKSAQDGLIDKLNEALKASEPVLPAAEVPMDPPQQVVPFPAKEELLVDPYAQHDPAEATPQATLSLEDLAAAIDELKGWQGQIAGRIEAVHKTVGKHTLALSNLTRRVDSLKKPIRATRAAAR